MTNLTPAEAWLKKYYPTPASKATKTELQAAKHSLRKWTGMLPENRQGLDLVLGTILEDSDGDTVLELDGYTCALCERHRKPNTIDCAHCILWKVTGISCHSKDSIYRKVADATNMFEEDIFQQDDAIRQMVKALAKCVRVLQRKPKKP